MRYRSKFNDNKKRALYIKTEITQYVLKILYLFKIIINSQLIIQKQLIFSLFRNSFKGRIKNYCVLTTRSRGVYRHFKVCRIMIRTLGATGFFFGLKKAS